MTMPITEARAALAETIDEVRTQREPLYLTRRHKPVAVLVDIASYTALTGAQAMLDPVQGDRASVDARHAERQRRLTAMNSTAAPFAAWVAPGTEHPASAPDRRTAGTIVDSFLPTPQAGLPITRPATRHGFSDFPLHPAEGRPLSEILDELREDRV